MSEQELIQAGISALKANDKQRAVSILAQVVQQYPQSERGWFLLGMSVDDVQKRTYCLQRVLTLNPNNPDAKKQLALLSPPKPAPPTPAWAAQPEPPRRQPDPISRPIPVPLPEKPTNLNASAFYTDEDEDAFIEPVKEAVQPVPNPPKANAPAKKKKSNPAILIASIVGICILAVAGIGALAILTNGVGRPSSQPAPEVGTPTSPAPIATQPVLTNVVQTPTALVFPTALPLISYTPQFEPAPCSFEIPTGANVTCGYAIVPENRTTNTGRTLRLAVAVFHSTSGSPAPDPVIFLQGGPGAEAMQLSVDLFPNLVQPFLSERDYITFDQRGTGFSEPSMRCDELDKVQRQDIYGGLASETRELVYQNAIQDCSGVLQSQGIDLTAYSTVESAADLRDIVKLLGYEKVNLYGASYGTRLALVTMRSYPEIVRSAILDSVVPVETNVIREFPQSTNSALSQMFISCAVDPECNNAYPELEKVFWDLIAQLDANPVTLTTSAYPIGTVTETLDGSYLLSVISGLLKTSELINTAPQTIFRVRSGDYTTLITAQFALPYEFDNISQGLYISMICREHALATTQEELVKAVEQSRVKSHVFRPFYGDFGKMSTACKSWGAEGPDLGEMDAVVSDIPSLVIEGSFDPATPPFFGKQVAEKLPNSYYFEFSNQGHVPTGSDTTGCAENIVMGFLRNPLVEPDSSCMNDLPKVKFILPYTGDPALKLKTDNLNGVTLKVPADWVLIDGGLYRGNSLFDVTEILAFREAISVDELALYFSSYSSYLGFDSSPAPTGTHQANGRIWSLYYTTSRKYPVDLAVADSGSKLTIIALFSHPDEHDAMYSTVFLPMVDSAK
ncbi:MAG: alpha/beta fold hydrolase [Chloroflexi bacterium]|nr:alpha/beta fold hydrolase [Chloroflexota bacterium]